MRIKISKKEVLEAIERFSPATHPEVLKAIGINSMYVSGYLRALEQTGIIKSKQVGTSIVYTVNPGGKSK